MLKNVSSISRTCAINYGFHFFNKENIQVLLNVFAGPKLVNHFLQNSDMEKKPFCKLLNWYGAMTWMISVPVNQVWPDNDYIIIVSNQLLNS